MGLVPKGPRAEGATVRNISSARSRGKPAGLGYDPVTGEEFAGPTYTGDGEGDVFATFGKRGYSEDRFYTRSVNEHNHGEKLNGIRIPQGIDSQIHALVREVAEYRHVNDFVRDAMVHRMEYLQRRYKLTPETRRFIELERLSADRDRRSQDIQMMQSNVADLQTKLEEAWAANDFGMLAKELDDGELLPEWMREPYRAQVIEMLTAWKRKAREQLERVEAQREE